MKIRKLYIDFSLWWHQELSLTPSTRRQNKLVLPRSTSDAVTLYGFWAITLCNYSWWPWQICSWRRHDPFTKPSGASRVFDLSTILSTHDVVISNMWRRQVQFPAWFETLSFSSLNRSKNVQNASFSRFLSKST
jgi:hypothetical protein